MKICYKCKEEKPISEFHKNKKTKDGLRYECKSCNIANNKKWINNNKKRRSNYNKYYYENVIKSDELL